MSKGEKLTKKKKLIISLSAVFGALIIIGAIILGLFCPRKLSGYVNVETSEVEEIYLQYWGESEEQRVYLDKEKINLFMFYVKNIKISPEYIPKKMDPSYSFCVKSKNRIYEISFMDLYIWENDKLKKSMIYHLYSGNVRDLLVLFELT